MSHQVSDADIEKLPPPAERAGGMRIPGHRGVANLTPASHGEKDRAREAAVKQLVSSQGESESAPSDLDVNKDKEKEKQKDKDESQKDKDKSKDKSKEEESSLSAASIIDTASNIGHKLMDAVMHPVQTAQEAVHAVSEAVSETVKNVMSGDTEEQGAEASAPSDKKSTEISKTQQAPVALTTGDRVASVALPEERRKVTQGDLAATKGHFPAVYHPPNNLAAQKHPNQPIAKYDKQQIQQPRGNNF